MVSSARLDRAEFIASVIRHFFDLSRAASRVNPWLPLPALLDRNRGRRTPIRSRFVPRQLFAPRAHPDPAALPISKEVWGSAVVFQGTPTLKLLQMHGQSAKQCSPVRTRGPPWKTQPQHTDSNENKTFLFWSFQEARSIAGQCEFGQQTEKSRPFK